MTELAMHDIECQRLALQAALDGKKSQEERNRLGQFATPTALARHMLAYSLSLLPKAEPVRFLDPAIGTGSFYSALRATTSASRIEAAHGVDIDPHYAIPARELWSGTPLEITLQDFTKATPPSEEQERFNLLICNPPYVRHHHMVTGEKQRLQQATEQAFGQRIDGLAGLYCYFLAFAHFWMRESGVAAWLIPSEFMNVNYGRTVKQYLLEKVTLLHIHRFDPNDVQFEDALVSSAVVIFRKQPPPPGHTVEFSYGGTLDAPIVSKHLPADELRRETKWTRFPAADVREATTGPTLQDFFTIKRGLATGDNDFFILTPEQIDQHRLEWQFFRPILPSPRYVEDEEILADENGLPTNVRKLFLLDCRLPEEAVKTAHPSLWAYLQTGVPSVSTRYLCKTRKPWYRQEERTHTPFMCTYIGRSDTKRGKPFRFILNHSTATVANVYLLLYPKPALEVAIAADPPLARKVWEWLNRIQPSELLEEGRVYGGGLHKLEPKELANVKADELRDVLARVVPLREVQAALF